jgi:glucoamylase
MTWLDFMLQGPVPYEPDLPVEIRHESLALLMRTTVQQSVNVPPGRYYVTSRLPAGQELFAQVDAAGDRNLVVLEPDEADLSPHEYLATQHFLVGPITSPPGDQPADWSPLPGAPGSVSVRVVAGNLLNGRSHLVLEVADVTPNPEWLLSYSPGIHQAPAWLQLVIGDVIEHSQTIPVVAGQSAQLRFAPPEGRHWRLDAAPQHTGADLLLRYRDRGWVHEAASVSDSLEGQAEEMLREKLRDPVAAAIGAYGLLRFSTLERLHDWTENLRRWFPRLPDGSAIRGEHLARAGDHHGALSAFAELWERGLPLFSDGLGYAIARLELYTSVGTAGFDRRRVELARRVLEALRPFAAAADFARPLLTIIGDVGEVARSAAVRRSSASAVPSQSAELSGGPFTATSAALPAATADAPGAPGAPGTQPTWAPGAKAAVTTALGGSRVWATFGQGILNEVYWPSAGEPQIRDLGFLLSGPGWWTEVKLNPGWTISTPQPDVPVPTVTHSAANWSLAFEVVPDPDLDVVLISWRLTGAGVTLHPLLAPHLEVHRGVDPAGQGTVGWDNYAWVGDDGSLLAEREGVGLCLAASMRFSRGSAGYVGASDGWQDFSRNGAMTWTWPLAGPGNVALTGEAPGQSGVLALAFASDAEGAHTVALESLARDFDAVRTECVDGWRRWALPGIPQSKPGDPPGLADAVRRCAAVIKVHEDHAYPGAFVASLSIPWGDSRGDLSGYHLVWPRDAVESGLALLVLGHGQEAVDLCSYLIATQQPDGHWKQNFFPDGTTFWSGTQLDETALPVMLAAKLAESGYATPAGTDDMVRRALRYLVQNGPLSPEDLWEENPGGSPFTLGVIVAALVAGAAFLTRPGGSRPVDATESQYLLGLADNWNERIEAWTYASGTDLDAKYAIAGHYVRIGAPPSGDPGAPWGPRGFISLKNQPEGTLAIPAALVTGLEFLYLVRLGLRAPDDQRIIDTITVVESELGQDVPTGRAYHRYEEDGYGETDAGDPFAGAGRGRLWPLLAGERGHYEILARREPTAQLTSMLNMAGPGGLIPEQVWDAADIPPRGLVQGHATGSAMPLIWAHAELAKLAMIRDTRRPVERLASIEARYGGQPPVGSGAWYWRDGLDASATGGATDTLPYGRDLIVEAAAPFTLHWGHDGWQDVADLDATALGFGRYGATVSGMSLSSYGSIQFTRRYADGWEGVDHAVALAATARASLPAPARARG